MERNVGEYVSRILQSRAEPSQPKLSGGQSETVQSLSFFQPVNFFAHAKKDRRKRTVTSESEREVNMKSFKKELSLLRVHFANFPTSHKREAFDLVYKRGKLPPTRNEMNNWTFDCHGERVSYGKLSVAAQLSRMGCSAIAFQGWIAAYEEIV